MSPALRAAATPPQLPTAVRRAAPVALHPSLSGDEALRRTGLACLAQMRSNEAALLAGRAEGIHQMRVAVRRLRAVLSSFRKLLPKKERRAAADQLRWVAKALGNARDLDVFEHALLAPAQRALAAEPGMSALAVEAEKRRAAAYRKAAKVVQSARYNSLQRRLRGWFEDHGWQDGAGSPALRRPIGRVAAKMLQRRRRAVKRRSRDFAKQSDARRHRLRIALKKLRYTAEPFAGVYDPAAVKRFVAPLKRLQDELGEANDVRVGRDIVTALVKQAPANAAALVRMAGERVLDWHEQRLAKGEAKLRRRLGRFLEAEPFWTS